MVTHIHTHSHMVCRQRENKRLRHDFSNMVSIYQITTWKKRTKKIKRHFCWQYQLDLPFETHSRWMKRQRERIDATSYLGGVLDMHKKLLLSPPAQYVCAERRERGKIASEVSLRTSWFSICTHESERTSAVQCSSVLLLSASFRAERGELKDSLFLPCTFFFHFSPLQKNVELPSFPSGKKWKYARKEHADKKLLRPPQGKKFSQL